MKKQRRPKVDPAEAGPAEVRRAAMDLLARREHARGELNRKLRHRGFEEAAVAAAVEQLAEEGLQSDQRYLESFLHARIQRGQGPVKIRAALSEAGVDGSEAEAALREAEVDWVALAREVRARKFGEQLPADYTEKTRQMRFLAGRGFSAEQCHAAVGEDDR